ncbi:NAD(P)/FAD-dependent oxidoreductase [Ralstonia solanacearum]|uniref:Sulfide dehydrogenase [flavocytochrome c] flavoprotein chain n=1 Tax=Ralstonia solanacearum (strain Po82) TaxID=1031711 RepID=F6G6G1_RALS8|nr:NAD(P)/FAD-dependent oxidoreductase [Ralstonia solanacearum]AEG67506.1 sulfide dehydrogenase [flavocytochrome c] flavoprotein chain [Ralstonia solanacearum Po82]AMP68904.1 flavocytochrome C [Ralstonia solanacearum]AMP74190.1 flavocytochrome C [Ralstonia solanacearum]AYB59270.1 flavocytochrome C [Ralstonia solanacearum]MBB6586022.1 FAD-dependent oxidoreductase [Ralstonia solanacearum]
MSGPTVREDRRALLRAIGATALAGPLAACASLSGLRNARVVVVGGGYGGATAAKYVRVFSGGRVDVTLVEPNAAFVSCPLSNLVLSGDRNLASLTVPYDALVARHGVRWVRDRAAAIDLGARQVRLEGGGTLDYDRLILSPGIDFVPGAIPGLAAATAARAPHAWKAGAQTLALRHRLEAMPNGGVVAISIPLAPYRCPPAPYERACLIAHWLQRARPASRVLILDANDDVTSKGALFKRVWAQRYPNHIEYRPQYNAVDIGAAGRVLKFDVQDDIEADVVNLIPPQRAGAIAVGAGLATANGRWCEVDFLTFESTVAPGVHVIGDAIQTAPLMPKSGHMANQHGKVAAAAAVAMLAGRAPDRSPLYANTCYSFTAPDEAMHVATVHRYDATERTMLTVPGAGGLSDAPSVTEGRLAQGWSRAIWSDMLG